MTVPTVGNKALNLPGIHIFAPGLTGTGQGAQQASGVQIASFAGAAGTQPAGVIYPGAQGSSQLDGQGHYTLTPNSGTVLFPVIRGDGDYTVSLAEPRALGFMFRASTGGGLSGFYTGLLNGALGLYRLRSGGYEGQSSAGSGLCPEAYDWTLHLDGTTIAVLADGLMVLTASSGFFPADGQFGVRLLEGATVPATLVSATYAPLGPDSAFHRTSAQADAAYLAAHPPGMTITGIG